jgi:hypothetical protein
LPKVVKASPTPENTHITPMRQPAKELTEHTNAFIITGADHWIRSAMSGGSEKGRSGDTADQSSQSLYTLSRAITNPAVATARACHAAPDPMNGMRATIEEARRKTERFFFMREGFPTLEFRGAGHIRTSGPFPQQRITRKRRPASRDTRVEQKAYRCPEGRCVLGSVRGAAV